MLRPISRLTRREVKALKDVIENPNDVDKLKARHPIIEEDERRYDQFEEKNKVLLEESMNYLATRHNKDILRKLIMLKS